MFRMAAVVEEILGSAFARMYLDQFLFHWLMCFAEVRTKPTLSVMKRNHGHLQLHESAGLDEEVAKNLRLAPRLRLVLSRPKGGPRRLVRRWRRRCVCLDGQSHLDGQSAELQHRTDARLGSQPPRVHLARSSVLPRESTICRKRSPLARVSPPWSSNHWNASSSSISLHRYA